VGGQSGGVHPNTPEQFSAKTRRDYENAAKLIKAAGIKPET
jgi:hypothetical protein